MAQQPVEGAEPGTVVEVYQQGYRHGDERPASRPRRRRRVGGRTDGRHEARPLQGRSASARTPPTRRSRRPTASSRASTTRTATRATRRPRSASRRSPRRYDVLVRPREAQGVRPAAPARSRPGGRRRLRTRTRLRRRSFGDILSNLFGGGGGGRRRGRGGGGARPRAPQRGRDLETEVSLTFEQAVDGAQVPLAVPTSTPCATCHGTGAKPGTVAEGLPASARAAASSPQGQGLFSITQPCSRCGGTRHDHRGPVPDLRRQRRARARSSACASTSPPGVREGSRVRIAGKGEPGRERRPAGRPVRRHARRRLAGLQAQGRQPRGRGAADDRPRRCAARPSRCRRCTARKTLRVAPGTKHGTVQRLRGEGPPKLGGRRPRRHPLPLHDRHPERSSRAEQQRGRRRARGGDERQPARAACFDAAARSGER